METFSALLALCEGNPPLTGASPHKASGAELWCFLWFSPEIRLSTQPRRRWVENAIALIVTSLYCSSGRHSSDRITIERSGTNAVGTNVSSVKRLHLPKILSCARSYLSTINRYKALAKWPSFGRRHLQMHLLERKCSSFSINIYWYINKEAIDRTIGPGTWA